MRLIICGGRNFDDHELFHRAVSAWVEAHGWPSEVITGGANGADALGKTWATENSVEHVEVQAEWEAFGRKAGPLRNRKMAYYASLMPGSGCLALPGGKGTAGMVELARAAGLTVMEVGT